MSAEAPGGNAVPVEAAACGKGEGQVYGRAYFRKGSICKVDGPVRAHLGKVG